MSSQPDGTVTPEAGDERHKANREGIVWVLADMLLVSGGMTALVKAQGLVYPAFQLVFIRAMIGLLFILPLIWRHRHHIRHTRHPWQNVSRISCNAIALTSQFMAYTLLPLAVVNALSFSRPLVTMAMAVAFLGETVSRLRWVGAAFAFAGVLVMLAPGGVEWNLGLLAVFATIVFGSLAIIQTRMLRDENTTVMMVFYTVGLAVITAVPAIFVWQPVKTFDWVPLLGIGLLAQAGQYCFLRAYRLADASLLAPIGYLSIVVTTAAGYVFFAEVPDQRIVIGAIVILAALQTTAYLERRANRKK
ncbi:DMT family transporter [Aminobacter ciceronei]|uniref:S-adenosylmethionine uptake transporter n=1 Tax=Aminobacter ciceronei TaxID=150723 RepID=A0ABR6C749_9HYPH|nr:S-adenosylmethionine uptake transporter [Aminobacter ciceronei]MBA9020834.1 S-adenosylmethionine uptake transporter [Aminobacter ciceronei]BBD40761.1 multidrug transporter [Aminobacter sp. SS-2016]